jgi:hypothetical protein
MTKAEILSAVRYLVNEKSTTAGAHLDDAGNLLEFVHSAVEDVVMDLMRFMPGQLAVAENITLIANQANYTLTASFWQIYKIEKNITGGAPSEIQIIDPLDTQFEMNVGETAAEPPACYLLGDTIYFVPTPSAAYTNYARAILIRPEAATLPAGGPAYIPVPAHRLVVYKAAELVAASLKASTVDFERLYAMRLDRVRNTWLQRYRQQVRYVKRDTDVRRAFDSRDRAFYDTEWP